MKKFNRTLISCAIGTSLALSLNVQAEETLPLTDINEVAETTDQVETKDSGVEVIMVTANKRSQTTQAIAAGITAMSGDMLIDRNIADPRDLSKVVPSMITGTGSRGEANINIRGVGFNEVGQSGVALHVDGVFQPRASMGRTIQMDIGRVEVLRGPQSTLYGRNANGGVVNYITSTPTTEDVEGSFTLGYADYNQLRVGGTVNVPLNDDFSMRASIEKFERKDGFQENVSPIALGNDMETLDSVAGRISIAGNIADDVTLQLIGTFSNTQGAISFVNAFEQSQVALPPGAPNPFANQTLSFEPFEVTVNTPAVSDLKYRALTAIVDWDLNDNWVLKSTTGYIDYEMARTGDFDGTDVNLVVGNVTEESETLSQEFNLSGEIGDVQTVFGLFYMDDDFATVTSFDFPLGYGPLRPSEDGFHLGAPVFDSLSIAVYADATWNVNDDFRVIAGIRYSDDEQEIVQDVYQKRRGSTTNLVFCTADDSYTYAEDNVLGRLGFQYDLSADSNIYATYSEGVKVGGVNPRAASCLDEFEPEEITSYEAGWKSSYLDGTLALNVSAFFYDYRNLQIQAVVGANVDVSNAPKSEVTGLEIDGNWVPDDHWNISASLSLINAEYTEYSNQNVMNLAAGFVDLAGNSMNHTPEVSSNLSIGYTTDPIEALGNGTLNFRTDVNYRSETTLREFELEGDTTEAYTLVDLSAIWLSETEQYKVRLYANNATEESYKMFMGASNLNGARAVRWNPPRVVGAEFIVQF